MSFNRFDAFVEKIDRISITVTPGGECVETFTISLDFLGILILADSNKTKTPHISWNFPTLFVRTCSLHTTLTVGVGKRDAHKKWAHSET